MREWLVDIRKIKGLTQKEVAENCGITRTGYASYEQGKRTPNASNSKAVGDFLGFSWTLFFEEKLHKACNNKIA